MNKIITTLAILLSTTLVAQLDITNDFESWTFTNTAGLEPYGAITTTLANGNAYKNADTTLMTSPVYNANGDIEIDFTLNGFIEEEFDFMYFQYLIGSEWVSLDYYTGLKDFIDVNFTLNDVSGDIQFRFALVTDYSINKYGKKRPNGCGYLNLMYFDISQWVLFSDNALPVEFGSHDMDCETIRFRTQSEYNSHSFAIFHSYDGITWEYMDYLWAMGFSTSTSYYMIPNTKGGGFIKITQIDIDGTGEDFGPFEIDCNLSLDTLHNDKTIDGYYNTMGQEIDKDTKGVKIVRYTDGTTKKIY